MVLLFFTYVLPLACWRTLLQALGTRTPLYIYFYKRVFNAEYTDQLSVRVYHELYLGSLKSGCGFALNTFGCIISIKLPFILYLYPVYHVYNARLVFQIGVIFTHYLKFMYPLSVFSKAEINA